MSFTIDNYSVLNYLQNYGSDTFDPFDYYNLNINIYDPNFVELIKHILCSSGFKCIDLYDKTKDISDIKPNIITITISDIDNLKKNILQLIILINDLMKIFVMLYNLEMGFAYYIQNSDINILKNNKKDIIDYLTTVKNIDDRKKYIAIIDEDIKKEKFFEPMKYYELKSDILNDLNDEEIIVLSHYLLERCVELENNIIKLLKLSEQINFIFDIEEISKIILSKIIPYDNNIKKYDLDVVLIGGVGKVIEAYNKLNELKEKLDSISVMTLEKEIPNGINLELNDIKKILSNLRIPLENKSSDKSMSGEEKEKTKKKYNINLFEGIPSYQKIKTDNFITNPLVPKLPDAIDVLKNMEPIITIINSKKQYFNEKIKDIKKTNKDLYDFDIKTTEFNKTQFDNINNLTFKFTNIGDIADIDNEIYIKKEELKTLETDKETKTNLKTKLEDSNFKEYIQNKIDLEKEKAKLTNIISQKDTIKNELITKLAKNIRENKSRLMDNDYKMYNDVINKILNKTDTDIKDLIDNDKFDDIYNIFNDISNKEITILIKNKFMDKEPIKTDKINLLNTLKNKTEHTQIVEKLKNITNNPEIQRLTTEITTKETNNPDYIQLYNNMNIQNIDENTVIDIDNIINQKKSDIEAEINQLDVNITTKKDEITKKEELKKSVNVNINYRNLLNFNEDAYKKIIELLHDKLNKININMIKIFNLKDNTTNPLSEGKIMKSVPAITSKWYDKTFNIGGGDYNTIIQKINKINDINETIKKLIVSVENYKSLSTDLFDKYISVIKNIQDILIYTYYKLTVFSDIKKGIFEPTEKLNKEKLEDLKLKLNNLSRKNFTLIKLVYIKLIDKILEKQTEEINANRDNMYIEYDFINKNSLLNLFVLGHLKNYIDVL